MEMQKFSPELHKRKYGVGTVALAVLVFMLSLCLIHELSADPAAGSYLEASVDLSLDYEAFVSKYGDIIYQEEYLAIQNTRKMEQVANTHCYIRHLEDGSYVVFVFGGAINKNGSYDLLDILLYPA